MSNKKQDQPLANAQNRQRGDQKQISFFKSKLSGLSPLNKFSPFKESSTYQLFNKNYASVDFTQQKQPLFKSIKQRSKQKELSSFDSQRSPHKSPNTSNYSSRQTTQKKDYTSRIQQVKRQEQQVNYSNFRKIPYDSLKSQNIYIESQKSISQALKQYQKPEDMKLILGLKSLIRKEKQVILNDVDQVIKQTDKYQSKITEITNDQEELKKQYQKMTQDEHQSIEIYGETISKYNKAIQLLHELQIDYDSLLPELQNDQTEESLKNVQQEENKDETILLQQFIIKKLVNKIEESKSLNQQLISKIKQ
ncbi:unnamed protein product (macronuclear) [Paramecium tetraurelia]|uniref:Nucleoporin Nup54 alpha-helical domain-containing protein n=1 Tax=Paramecium tetraurelia TaxID=5888 RepID=A0BKE0_PARTE|nr:uncharacterized protein GSPATT00029638001 [Paramecium tetraurelia]CAK59007.1 unnamed protein product [Paramecium tetraurelia]|eukprot:XP_001426405.1 hypothetical protein (macronuclear) [Paramecium tetraurelia strain d4-2]